jgi:hypothetical protein
MKKYIKIVENQIVEITLEPRDDLIEFECADPGAGIFLFQGQLVEGYYNPNEFVAENIAAWELNDRRHEARAYLVSTDWYAVRKAETGQAIPADVLEQRQTARALLSS